VFEGHVFFLGKIKLMNIFSLINNQKAPAEASVPFALEINTVESIEQSWLINQRCLKGMCFFWEKPS